MGSAAPAANERRGLGPDHPIRYTIADKLSGRDLEKDKALELIRGRNP